MNEHKPEDSSNSGSITESFWESVSGITFANEADVEQQFVVPLVQALGWPLNQLHSKVPVSFQRGRRPGRKPEADFALAPA